LAVPVLAFAQLDQVLHLVVLSAMDVGLVHEGGIKKCEVVLLWSRSHLAILEAGHFCPAVSCCVEGAVRS
jgi:hypothetical protein